MTFEPIFHLRGFHLTVKTRVLRTNVSGPFDNHEEAQNPSREPMIAEIMSVFSPPPFV